MKNSCPNFNSPEWKALENNPSIGKFEAMRDWLENDGVIRTPEEVIKKISEKKIKYRVFQIDKDGTIINTFNGYTSAGKNVGVSKSCIMDVCNGKSKISKGYFWKSERI